MNRIASFVIAFLAVVAPAGAQLVCPANPPLRSEKGPLHQPGHELTSEEFDLWLANIRYMCANAASGSPAASGITIDDPGNFYTGTSVEAALQEIGAGTTLDGRYAPISHTHAAADITSGTLAAARLPAATTAAQGAVILATPSSDTTAGHAVQANDARLSDSRAPSGTAGGGLTGSYPNPTVATVPAGALPNPSATTLGGVQSIASASHNFLTSISTSGVPAKAQPACGDLSDAAASCATDATNPANLASAVPVSKGGTGLAALTAHYVLFGNGTSAPTLLAPGTSGYALISNGAGSDPSWQAVGGMVYPGAGVANSTGSAWGTSYTVGSSANNIPQLNSSAAIPVTAVVSPSSLSLTATGNNFLEVNITGNNTMYFKTQNTDRWTIDPNGELAGAAGLAINLTLIKLTPGAVGPCSSGQKGYLRVAADGSLCNCTGIAWVATPLSGSCS